MDETRQPPNLARRRDALLKSLWLLADRLDAEGKKALARRSILEGTAKKTAASQIRELVNRYQQEPVPTLDKPECPLCGTWTCAGCGWVRPRANRLVSHHCGKCGSTVGTMIPTLHHRLATYEEHVVAAAAGERRWKV